MEEKEMRAKKKKQVSKHACKFNIKEAHEVIDAIIADLEMAKANKERLLNGFFSIYVDQVVKRATIKATASLNYDHVQSEAILGRTRKTLMGWREIAV